MPQTRRSSYLTSLWPRSSTQISIQTSRPAFNSKRYHWRTRHCLMSKKSNCMTTNMDLEQAKAEMEANSETTTPIRSDGPTVLSSLTMRTVMRMTTTTSIGDLKASERCQARAVGAIQPRMPSTNGSLRGRATSSGARPPQGKKVGAVQKATKRNSDSKSLTNSMSSLTSKGKRLKKASLVMIHEEPI